MKKFIVILILFITSCSFASAQRFDGQSWIGIKYEQEIIKDIEVEVEQELRLRNYILLYNTTLTDIGITYKPKKFIRIGGGYRISLSTEDIEHRISGHITPRVKLKDINLTFRFKYQAETRNNEQFFSHGLRQKAEFKYTDFKDWRPYLFAEIFYLTQYDYHNFNRYRIGMGTEIDIVKGHDLDVGIFYQHEINQENPWRAITLTLKYIFNP